MKLLVLIILFTISCAKPESKPESKPVVNSNKLVNIKKEFPFVLSLPEPLIQEDKKTRFKLTQLAVVKEKFLTISDHIVFSGLENKINLTKHLKDIKLHVKSHCIIDQKKVMIQNFERNLTLSIPIIELLPVEVLIHKYDLSSCGFSFKAIHKDGSAHHFELPQLPIKGYNEDHIIKIFSDQRIINKDFSYIKVDNISDYWLDLGTTIVMDKIDLICDDFDLSITTSQQQIIPLSAFLFHTLDEEVQNKIKETKPNQNCRIFGYKNKVLSAVSAYINMLYYQVPLKVDVDSNILPIVPTSYAQLVRDEYQTARRNQDDDKRSIFTYSIKNHKKHDVYILIKDRNDNGDTLQVGFYNLYYSLTNSNNTHFYDDVSDDMELGEIETIGGRPIKNKIKKVGTFITLQPGTSIQFSVLFDIDLEICEINGKENLKWLGGIMKYPDLKIYQLFSDNIKDIPLSQNIQHTLDTQAGTGFAIHTEYLGHHKKLEKIKSVDLFFKYGSCYDDKVMRDPLDPQSIIYVDSNDDGNLRANELKWINYYDIDQIYFKDTQLILKNYVGIVDKYNNPKPKKIIKNTQLYQPSKFEQNWPSHLHQP